MVTLKKMAEELGLSVSTVSRVINKKGSYPEETRLRVLKKAKELGYTPNIYARSLRERTYKVIGLIVPNVLNPFYSTILQVTEEECNRRGYTLLCGVTGYSKEREDNFIDYLVANQASGVIIVSDESERDIKGIQDRGIQVISLNEYGSQCDVDWISIDSYTAMKDLVQYLINLGHRDIACIYGLDGFIDSETETNRLNGYIDCMKENSLTIDKNMIIGTYENYLSSRRAAAKLLNLQKKPTAIVCHNNDIATAVYDIFNEAKYVIPRDISIACFDSIIPEGVKGVLCTSIVQPLETISAEAVRLITERKLEEREDKNRLRLRMPYHLKIGETTSSKKD